MRFHVLIPARHASARLPGKPLLEIAGRPMLEWTCRQALAAGAASVVVATDDDRIARAAEGFGVAVCMTAASHRSGTERLAEAVQCLGLETDEIVVNLQGDEPLMPPSLLRQVAAGLQASPQAEMATLCTPICRADELFDPNIVKVVMDARGMALYFSRAPIPWDRDGFDSPCNGEGTERRVDGHWRHIGLYAYRAGFLARYASLPACALEQMEKLEQLRTLWHGIGLHVAAATEVPPAGVDTAEDLARVAAILEVDKA